MLIELEPLNISKRLCAYMNVTGADMGLIIYKVYLGNKILTYSSSEEERTLELWRLAESLSGGDRAVFFEGPTWTEWISGICYARISYP